jgi:hypothetical protein
MDKSGVATVDMEKNLWQFLIFSVGIFFSGKLLKALPSVRPGNKALAGSSGLVWRLFSFFKKSYE